MSAVSLTLTRKGGDAPAPQAPVTMWELRDRLPSDVLRELGIEPNPVKTAAQPDVAARRRAPVGGRRPRPRSRRRSDQPRRRGRSEHDDRRRFGDDRRAGALARRGRPPRRPAERLAVRHQRRLRDARRRAGRGRNDRQRGRTRPRRRDVGSRQAPPLDAPQLALLRRKPREPPVARGDLEPRERRGPRRIGRRALHRRGQPLPRDGARHDALPARLEDVGSQRALRPRRDRHARRRGGHDLPASRSERRPLGRRRRRRVLPGGAGRGSLGLDRR